MDIQCNNLIVFESIKNHVLGIIGIAQIITDFAIEFVFFSMDIFTLLRKNYIYAF